MCFIWSSFKIFFQSVAIILKSNISHNILDGHCHLKFQTFWHIGYAFLSEQFAVAGWQVLYSSPESHHSTFTLVAYLPGPWRSLSLTPSVYSLFQSLSLYCISLLAKMFLGTFFFFFLTNKILCCLYTKQWWFWSVTTRQRNGIHRFTKPKIQLLVSKCITPLVIPLLV